MLETCGVILNLWGIQMTTNEGSVIGVQRGALSSIITIEVFEPIEDGITLGYCELVQEKDMM